MSTSQMHDETPATEGTDIYAAYWTPELLEQMERIKATRQRTEAKRRRTRMKTQQVLQKFEHLKKVNRQLREDIREHGRALDKMTEKNEERHAENEAFHNKMDCRVSRLETKTALVLTAMVAIAERVDTPPSTSSTQGYALNGGSNSDSGGYDLQ